MGGEVRAERRGRRNGGTKKWATKDILNLTRVYMAQPGTHEAQARSAAVLHSFPSEREQTLRTDLALSKRRSRE